MANLPYIYKLGRNSHGRRHQRGLTKHISLSIKFHGSLAGQARHACHTFVNCRFNLVVSGEYR